MAGHPPTDPLPCTPRSPGQAIEASGNLLGNLVVTVPHRRTVQCVRMTRFRFPRDTVPPTRLDQSMILVIDITNPGSSSGFVHRI
jgi:hypothetical protein